MLQMVMGDLIANAVKLAKLRAKTIIEVGWLPDVKNETVIFIQDNAAGFDAQFAGKLFNVFKRRPGQPGFEDEGMGPANIQREIQRHGGRSWATGMVDKGSTFYFSIPADENRSGFAMKA